jgi:hypothetical protein
LPNIPGLGSSTTSQHYAIDLETYLLFLENQQFRRNIFLMIRAIHEAYRKSDHMNMERLLGNNPVDALKWKSCLTLTWYAYLTIDELHDDWFAISSIVRDARDTYGLCDQTVEKCRPN